MEARDPVTERLAAVERARSQLVGRGLARRATESEADATYFLAAELASVLEHRRGISLDPATLTRSDIGAWRLREARAVENLEAEPRAGALVLVDDGAAIGTVCFDDFEGWSRYAQVSSLYVAPGVRSRGVASGLLDTLHALLTPAYSGLALTTYWTWPRATRFYLRHGCSVRQWKHALVFLWRTPEVEWNARFDGDVATFSYAREGHETRTLLARRSGDWLDWTEPEARDLDSGDAMMTFAVLLASRGWPIARSPETLAEGARWSDGGYPEGLASRIERWEADDRDRGFVIDTPRLPSLPYRAASALAEE